VCDRTIVDGPNGIAGEWGHIPLPRTTAQERAGPHRCWCGQTDCLETWISGSAFVADYGEPHLSGADIVARARGGEDRARAALDRYVDRLGRALAVVCNLLDPDVIVLGGGMSNTSELYDAVPAIVTANLFSDFFATPIRQASHGDSSGVRGAAWLWPNED
ncbi:MAG: hypothetical protein JWM33_2181, partial [Caulobacteraceae bacterium]|nr:hypothetical protein [Caulobacteraceae bacterium]